MAASFNPDNPFKNAQSNKPMGKTVPVPPNFNRGMKIEQCFSAPGVHPFDELAMGKALRQNYQRHRRGRLRAK